LEHYIPGLRKLPAHQTVPVREIVETGELPLREGAGTPPAGFRLIGVHRVNGLIAFRFVTAKPRQLSEEQLRRYAVDPEPWVLVPGNARASR
jgi:hypothetical protein